MPGMTFSTDLYGAGNRGNRDGNMGHSPYETMGYPKEKSKKKKPKKIRVQIPSQQGKNIVRPT